MSAKKIEKAKLTGTLFYTKLKKGKPSGNKA